MASLPDPDSAAAAARPATETRILVHTALTALTPLIPLPVVNGIARAQVEQGLVKALAAAHGLALDPEDVQRLCTTPKTDNPVHGSARGAARGLVLLPVKTLFKQYLPVLLGKRIVEIAGETYCRGVLVDHVFAEGWCRPAGERTAAEVRDAIDAVLKESPVAKEAVTAAIRAGLVRSKDAASGAFSQVRRRLISWQRSSDQACIDAAEEEELAVITEELRRSLDEVPSEHLDVLRASLAQRLASSTPDLTSRSEPQGRREVDAARG